MTMTRNVSTGRLALALAVAVAVVGSVGMAGAAHAESKRCGILKFHGPAEGATRNAVGESVHDNSCQIVGAIQIDKTAKRLGVKLNSNDSFRSVAKELGITSFIGGEVTKKKATLTIRNGEDGAVAGDAVFLGANPRKLAAGVQKNFWKKLGSAIEGGHAPSGAKAAVVAEEAPAPETGADEPGGSEPAGEPSKSAAASEEKETKKSSASASDEAPAPRKSKKKKAASSDDEAGSETTATAHASASEDSAPVGEEAVDVGVGVGVLTRSLSYNNDMSGDPSYSLPRGPAAGFAADVFPGALMGMSGFVPRLGLTVALNSLIPGTVTTNPPNGPGKYTTRGLAWSVGVKARLFSGVYATVAYGDRAFGLTASGGAQSSLVPMTDYRYARIGAGGRWRLTPDFSVMANLGYLKALGYGDIGKTAFFPKVSGAAFEAGAAAGYKIGSKLEARLGVDFQRFGLAFNVPYSSPPPAKVAGGAIDQYVSIWLGVAYVMGGGESAAAASSSSDSESGSSGGAKGEDDSS
jgi:hypothetical protein